MSAHSRLLHQRAVVHMHTHPHTDKHNLIWIQTNTQIQYKCILMYYTNTYVDISKNALEYAYTLSQYVWTQTHTADGAVHAHTRINTHTYTHTYKQTAGI